MSLIPLTPTSPGGKRSLRLSGLDMVRDAPLSPNNSGTTQSTLHSRQSSRTSQTSYMNSPITPRPNSARSSRPSSFYHRRKSSSRLSIGSNISFEANGNGLGNLADELEDALEDGYEMNESGYLEDMREGDVEPVSHYGDAIYDGNGNDVEEQKAYPHNIAYTTYPLHSPTELSPTKTRLEKRKVQHQRTSSQYSDYALRLDQDEDGFTPALAKRMKDIETLARTSLNTEDALSEDGGVIHRTTTALQDLSPQANIEAHLSRIISAYTSMATHRTHKTRDLFTQAHWLLYTTGSNTANSLPEPILDTLISELDLLSARISLPFIHQHNPLHTLQLLASQTLDLAQTLRTLTDTLQESRISTATATRKLKSVRDMVDDICAEQELAETSMMLIQAGDWDRRCRERQAAAMCADVVRGFGGRWGVDVDDTRPWMVGSEGVVL